MTTTAIQSQRIFMFAFIALLALSFGAVASESDAAPSETTALSLGKDETGAVVWGKGHDIQGEAHLADVRYSGGNFWAQGAPVRLETWINAQTKLHTQLLPSDRAVDLFRSPMEESEAPIQDREASVEREGIFNQPLLLMSHTDTEFMLNPAEFGALRSYLVRGGFLFVDDDMGVAGSFQKRVLVGIRTALPETRIKPEPIPPDHPIYRCLYEMKGPPKGSREWQKHRKDKRDFLEGIFIGDRLAVLLSDRGYWEALTAEGPKRPDVMRFATNLVVYALTHGSIIDHSRYQP